MSWAVILRRLRLDGMRLLALMGDRITRLQHIERNTGRCLKFGIELDDTLARFEGLPETVRNQDVSLSGECSANMLAERSLRSFFFV